MVVTATNNIIYGGPFKKRVTENSKSLGEFILKRFDELGEKVVLVDGVSGKEYAAKTLKKKFIEFAICLRELGVKEGTAVCVCSENRIEFAQAIFATILLNATFAPINATYTEREIEHALNLSKAKVIFTSSLTEKKVAAVARRYPFVHHVICFDRTGPSENPHSYTKFIKLSSKGHPNETFQVAPTNVNENVVLILCSSGTTGLPKGVEITQYNLLHTIDGQFLQNSINPGSVVLNVLPWFHTYGLVHLITRTAIGTKIVFLPKFHEEQFLSCIQRHRVSACLMVPPLMVFLAKHPMVSKFDLSSLKQLYCGAASMSKEVADAVKKRIGVPVIRQGYGMSEATLSVTVQTDEHSKEGSVGTVRAATYLKVVDPKTQQILGPNQPGEICIKGGSVMKGYVGDKTATAEAIDSDGWLHTGDIGYYDEEFHFFLIDRIKELIKYKGFQVPPAELEALLLTNPKIKDAAVVGLPDEECGELPLAYVVKADKSLTEREVIDYVASKSSPAKRLHGGVRFVAEIPKNHTGKILRRVLRDMVKNESKSKL